MSESDNSAVTSFDFSDISIQEISVIGPPPDRGNYVLREADAATRKDYQNTAVKGMRFKHSRTVPEKVDGIGELELMLVGKCLFKVVDGEAVENPVGSVHLSKWPNRVVSQLYDWVRDHSGFTEVEDDDNDKSKEDDETKNS